MRSAQQIIQQLEAAGLYVRFLPIGAMEQIREHYDSLSERAPETGTAKRAAEHFRSNQPPKLEFEPKSFLVIALPPGQAGKLVLTRRGKRVEVPIMPFRPVGVNHEERLKEVLAGIQLGHTRGISQKLLVALSGLGQYGRNNICYVGDWGTYTGLDAFYTDVPYEGPVYPDVRMAACEDCSLCRAACPTGAIGEQQVIDANRCLTMRNENTKRVPRWVPKDAHHVLIGCARCQECCPMNPKLDYDSHALALNEAETRQLLSPGKKLPKALEQKLRAFGLDDWHLRLIKRNARLVVKAKEAKK